MKQENIKKSSIYNLDANIVILIGYLGGLLLSASFLAWLLPFIIYLLEKKNEFVKKQMVQATTLYLISACISLIIRAASFSTLPLYSFEQRFNFPIVSLFITGIFILISVITGIIIIVLSIVAMVKTWKYEDYEMPIICKLTPYVRKIIIKINSETPNDTKSTKEPTQTKEKETSKDSPSKTLKKETNQKQKKQTSAKKIKTNQSSNKKTKGETKHE